MSAKDQRCYLSKAEMVPESLLPSLREPPLLSAHSEIAAAWSRDPLSLHTASLLRFCSLTFWSPASDFTREHVFLQIEGRLAW